MRTERPATRGRFMRASFWSFGLLLAEKLIGVARVLVLAILLRPREFGLFGFALLAILAADALSRTGFRQALIREGGDVTRHLDAAWSVQLLRGLFLALVLFAIAPWVADYFQEPGAMPLVRVLALSLALQGLGNIGVIYFHRELDFRRDFIFRLSGTLADLFVAAAAAWLLRSAWALALGMVASSLTRLVVSYRIHPYRPRFCLPADSLRHLFGYGLWLWLSAVTTFIGFRGTDLLVGRLVGAAGLGLYQMAFRIPEIAIREVSASLGNVALPTYAHVQDDLPRLRRSYLGISTLGVVLAAPAAVGILILGEPFIRDILGQAWLPMTPALGILAFAGLVTAISATGTPLFFARGVARLRFHVQFARAVALALLVYPLTARWGITGAAACVLLAALAGSLLWVRGVRRVLDLPLKDFALTLLPPLLAALLMGAVLYPVRLWTDPWLPPALLPRVLWMAGLILAGALLYLGGLWASLRLLPMTVILETIQGILARRGLGFPSASRGAP